MSRKSLLKSISVVATSIALVLSTASLGAANTSEIKSDILEASDNSQLWGELSSDRKTCHSTRKPLKTDSQPEMSVALEKAHENDTAKTGAAIDNQLIVCSQS